MLKVKKEVTTEMFEEKRRNGKTVFRDI